MKDNKQRKQLLREIARHRELYLMFIPVALFYLVFCYYPMYGVTLAFKQYSIPKGIFGSPWVGFEYFKQLFETSEFLLVFRNTVVISLLKLIFTFPVPIALAIMLNEMLGKRFKSLLQTSMYLPYFISWVIMANLIMGILSVDGGIVNKLIEKCGGQAIPFITTSKYFYPILILGEIWTGAGWGTIIYTAAMQGVNPELYEAAAVDGCGRFRKIFSVTLPCMSMTITIMFILAVGGIMNAGFDPIFNLYNPAVYGVADIIDTYVYRIGLTQGLFEKSTAVGLFKSVINFALLVVANLTVKKITGESIYA